MKKLALITLLVLFAATACAQETKITAAVMDLEAKQGISVADASLLSDYLRTQLVNVGKFTIVTRENMEMILNEQKLQLTGCTSRECVVQVGQVLGVRKMFSGSVGKVGQTYQVDLKVYDVESGQIEKAECEICQKCEIDALYISLRNIASKISGFQVKEEAVPQSAQPAKELQSTLLKTEEITWKKDSSQMIYIPAGEFTMGSPEGEGNPNEHPQHNVYVNAYYINKYEITNGQFSNFLNEWGKDTDENEKTMIYENSLGLKKISGWFKTPQEWKPSPGYEDNPAIDVTWYGAVQYAKWAGKRLPTEAEWEKACRAGSTTKYSFGDEKSRLFEHAWFKENSGGKTHPVGTRLPNIWGIYDMHGNVVEWCVDWYDENYYKSSPYKNPQGPSSPPENGRELHIVRGGSWNGDAGSCRSAYREYGWYYGKSFRCTVSASDVPK